jgi:hypothetical protein
MKLICLSKCETADEEWVERKRREEKKTKKRERKKM